MRDRSVVTAQRRTVACIGFDWRAELSLKATLALLGGKTADHWDYCDDISADVVIYDTGNDLGHALARLPGIRQVYFPCSNEHDGEIELTLHHPFGASRLIHCLDHASELLSGRAPADAVKQDSLCQRIDDALQAPGVVGVALLAGERSGLLVPELSALHWPVPLDLDEMARLLSADVGVRALRAGDHDILHALAAPDPMPAHLPLWAIGVATSGGQLLRRLDRARAYRITRWPDYSAIGRRATDSQCSSLLMQQALSPAHLSMASGLPAAVVNNFVNACALCDFLEAAAAPAAVAATARTHSGAGVVQRLRQALAIGH